MNSLNLKFGGIDLIFCDGKYYFIEVNPTGEWGWLETVAGLKISDEICNAMMR
jgi:glutathione synthase/RimK-type ligase-like ATP-grasp enzyme